MTRLSETVYAAVYEDEEGEYIQFKTIAPTPEIADDIDADFRKYDWSEDYGDYQRIGKFRIEERVWER